MAKNYHLALCFLILIGFLFGLRTQAQVVQLYAPTLVSQVEIILSPSTGTFDKGTTFDVPIVVNTNGANINGVDIRLNFDKDKLEIVRPSGGVSFIGVWVEPANYDNTLGVASYVGVIPNGITTSSGLVGTITFKAKNTGKASVSFSSSSRVLLNDGQGTEADVVYRSGLYTIVSQTQPEGVEVTSSTHPAQSDWYNNNSPIVSWNKALGVSGFSYVLDNKPSTVPDSVINTTDTSKSFEKLEDGLWYFHIKADKNGIWGNTAHFSIHIDTMPPAEFKPKISYLIADKAAIDHALLSFSTTDSLSGLDHYEVGIMDKSQGEEVPPVFVQTESPFQISLIDSHLNATVRAVDKAGNIRDVSIDLGSPSLFSKFIEANYLYIILSLIFLGILFILHYITAHHLFRYIKKAMQLMKKDEAANIEHKEPPTHFIK